MQALLIIDLDTTKTRKKLRCLTVGSAHFGCAGGKRPEGREAVAAGGSSRALKLLSCHWGSASCETKEEDGSRRLGPYVRVHLKVRGAAVASLPAP